MNQYNISIPPKLSMTLNIAPTNYYTIYLKEFNVSVLCGDNQTVPTFTYFAVQSYVTSLPTWLIFSNTPLSLKA